MTLEIRYFLSSLFKTQMNLFYKLQEYIVCSDFCLNHIYELIENIA